MVNQLFELTSFGMLMWVLLIILPNWRITKWLVRTAAFPIFIAILYTIGLIQVFTDQGFGFMRDFGSVSGVLKLLIDPNIAIVVWIHLLAFDQLAALYIYRDNMEGRYLPVPLQSAIFIMCFLFGPGGLLVYSILKWARIIVQRLRATSKTDPNLNNHHSTRSR